MYCCECGNQLQSRGEAYLTCCSDAGYWYDKAPELRDQWYPVPKIGKWYLFLNGRNQPKKLSMPQGLTNLSKVLR